MAHPQGVDSQPAPEILKWPLALRRENRDKLSHGDPTTQRAATIWLLKGVLILLKLKGKKKASKKVRHKEEKNEPDEGSGLLSEIS